jgi:transcription elongation factor Elf1
MTFQILGPTAYPPRRCLERPACPHCGDTPLAPEASELVARRLIRHSWSCDSCGHDFATAIRLFGRQFVEDMDYRGARMAVRSSR